MSESRRVVCECGKIYLIPRTMKDRTITCSACKRRISLTQVEPEPEAVAEAEPEIPDSLRRAAAPWTPPAESEPSAPPPPPRVAGLLPWYFHATRGLCYGGACLSVFAGLALLFALTNEGAKATEGHPVASFGGPALVASCVSVFFVSCATLCGLDAATAIYRRSQSR